jgi:hypothetical protein
VEARFTIISFNCLPLAIFWEKVFVKVERC